MPDGPIGSRENRVRKALYWHWTKDLTQEEIGDKLGVSRRKVAEYVSEAPQSEAVREQLDNLEVETRYVAAQTLRDQLKAAGERAASAEKPVKVWPDDDGNLCVKDKQNDAGETVDRYVIPESFELGADEQAQFYGRSEVREIIDLLTDITGAKAAERHEHEHSGSIESKHTLGDAEKAAIRDGLAARRDQE